MQLRRVDKDKTNGGMYDFASNSFNILNMGNFLKLLVDLVQNFE